MTISLHGFANTLVDSSSLNKKGFKRFSKNNPNTRSELFEYLNTKISPVFGEEGFKENLAFLSETATQKWDSRVIERAQESYFSQSVVYGMDGPNMIGQMILLHTYNHQNNTSQPVMYCVDAFFCDYAEGLVAYGLVPVEQGADKPPRIFFRGTDILKSKSRSTSIDIQTTQLPSGVKADIRKAVGKQAYEQQAESMTQWLKEQCTESKAIISGHSLGGILVQRLAADPNNRGLIKKVFTVNAPMLDRKTFETINSINNSGPDYTVEHLIVSGDIVTKAGYRLLPGTVYKVREKMVWQIHSSRVFYDAAFKGLEYSFTTYSSDEYAESIKISPPKWTHFYPKLLPQKNSHNRFTIPNYAYIKKVTR